MKENTHKDMNPHPSEYTITPFAFLIASIAAIGGILFGFDTGVISGAILFIKVQFHLSALQNGVVVSASLVGAVVGAGIGGWFTDKFGRKKLLKIAALIFIIGTTGSAIAFNITSLVIARIILGFGIGIASFTAPLYISEIAPPKFRGALVSLNQLAVTIGIFLSYFVDVYFSRTADWRWMFAIGVIPALILFIGLFFLPRSPRWLLLSGNTKAALKTLRTIRQSEHVQTEFEEIKHAVSHKSDWRILLRKWLRPALFIGIALGFFQQFTGINTVIYYAPTIFNLSGFSSDTVSILATAGVGAINVISTVVALFLIDRLGRKKLLYIGTTLMLICLLALGAGFQFAPHMPSLRWLTFISLMIYVIGFAIGLGPIMWLMFTEIFPLKVRGVATSLVASLQWLFNFIVSLTFLTFIKYFHEIGTFGLYAGICCLCLLFVYFKLPETKGVSLEKIEQNLRAGVRSKDLGTE